MYITERVYVGRERERERDYVPCTAKLTSQGKDFSLADN
jgi:hypothetical protein